MSLWNIIRDFFVQYIFGGTLSNGSQIIHNIIGKVNVYVNGSFDDRYLISTDFLGFVFNGANFDYDYESQIVSFISVGDWLSTTATIITLCAICFFLFLFVRWLFRLTSGLIQARG